MNHQPFGSLQTRTPSNLARGVGGHEPPAGPREQLLADVARLDDHLAVVVDQDGHVDVPAGDARELVALPVGDLDEVVASAEEIEQHLGLRARTGCSAAARASWSGI